MDASSTAWFVTREGLIARLRSLMLARAAVGTALLSTTTLLNLRVEAPLSLSPFVLIGLLYLLTIVYSILLERVRNTTFLAVTQLFGDLLLISGVLVLSGGSNSPFAVLCSVTIVAGSIVLYRPGGYVAAFFSCLMLTGLTLLESFQVLPSLTSPPLARFAPELSLRLSQLFLNFFGFFLIAHLSGHLAERLRRSGEMLDRSHALLEAQSQNLLELRHFSNHILQSIHSGLLTTDTHGSVISTNRAASELLGPCFGKLTGRSILELFPTLNGRHLEQASQQQLSFDVALEIRPGQRRILELIPNAFSGLTGRTDGYIFVLRDITDLRRLEALEKESDKLAALGEMASTIAHEIRNPLASMRGSIELLSKELTLSGTNQRLMEIVLRESNRLNKLVTDFLSYARQPPPRLELVDLVRLLEDVSLLLENDRAWRNIEVRLELHAVEAPLNLDAEQFRQVVWNLAQNGFRAMAGRGILTLGTREVLLREETGEAGICLWVQDTGCGMSADELGQIFQPFKSRHGWGAGLGLAIVKRVVTAHHGDIEIQSKPGGGTTVLVYLPQPSAAQLRQTSTPVAEVVA